MRILWSVWLAACLTPAADVAAESDDVLLIGSRRELFVDDALIDTLQGGARLHLHKPVPREVVLTAGAPWEGNSIGYLTVIEDDGLYRMYYRGRSGGREVTCYAESTDGIGWAKPELGLFNVEGSKANNIVWAGLGVHNFTPFKDTNPHCPPEARYKAVGDRGHAVLYAFQSPDGIHWQVMNNGEPILIPEGDIRVGRRHFFDSQNVVFWDNSRKEYVMYFREWDGALRMIRTLTSCDFDNWEYGQSERLSYRNTDIYARGWQLYTNAVRPYERAPHISIGFPTRLMAGASTQPYFMASRDGRQFYFWGEDTLIPQDAPKDRHGNRGNYIQWGLVRTGENEYSIYATEGGRDVGESRLRRFTYRVDGFASVRGSDEGGEMLTKLLAFSGDRLEVNFAALSEDGFVRIELRDTQGRPLPGFAMDDCDPLTGDAIERIVTWNGESDISRLAGRPLRLRIELKSADLFSYMAIPKGTGANGLQ